METATKKKHQRSVTWCSKSNTLELIDQRKLPVTLEVVRYGTVKDVARAIKQMVVRGAPAIGAAGAFGMALAFSPTSTAELSADEVKRLLSEAKRTLDASRPTAVNLEWATARIVRATTSALTSAVRGKDAFRFVLEEAKRIAEEDVSINTRMGVVGGAVVRPGANVLHHCNTGSLATVDRGTALGVIYQAHDDGKGIHVWVDETRPRLQGSRLTAWELQRYGVPLHLIADNAAGMLMRRGKVDIVLVGADRVALNGDVVNKIGTYKLSVLARENGVPFYPVVPTSTIDLACLTGDDITIEERDGDEVRFACGGTQIAPKTVPVFNPAFDVTPHKYITGIITEEGICYPPFEKSLSDAKRRAENRISSNTSLRASL